MCACESGWWSVCYFVCMGFVSVPVCMCPYILDMVYGILYVSLLPLVGFLY